MSAPLGSTAPLRSAGPLTFPSFVGAIFHAGIALERGRTVPGLDRPLSMDQLFDAALRAVDPYCDGDRAGAEEAIAQALTSGWGSAPLPARERARSQGRALLIWLERHDPALN
jgi:hypothetical protein